MESLKAFTRKASRGFSLIEILLVIGLFTLIGGVGLYVGMDNYRGSSFWSDRDLLIATLQHARAQAINNKCSGTCTDGTPYGVHIATATPSYVIFQGNTYSSGDPQNAAFSANPSITRKGITDVVFSTLTATTTSGEIVLSDAAGHISTTTIGSEGQISWTH